jgi:hypothetical protein
MDSLEHHRWLGPAAGVTLLAAAAPSREPLSFPDDVAAFERQGATNAARQLVSV